MVKLEFNRPSVATRHAFEAWLHETPMHTQAWERVCALRNEFAAVPSGLASHALHSVDKQRQASRLSRRQTLKLLMLAGVAVGAGWAVREQVPWQRAFADASTAVGQQRTLQLDDGTTVILNTDSAIRIVMQAEERRIILQRGEIMITTGSDAAFAEKRPFRVETPYGTMQALGTQFVVRLDAPHARISVQEGAVRMYPAGGSNPAVAHVGESWWLSADKVMPAPQQDFRPDGWTDGMIVGQNMRLADLLAELSRYRRGRIVCDAEVADLRVSGIYHVQDTDKTLRFLLQTQPVSVTYYTRFWVAVGADHAR